MLQQAALRSTLAAMESAAQKSMTSGSGDMTSATNLPCNSFQFLSSCIVFNEIVQVYCFSVPGRRNFCSQLWFSCSTTEEQLHLIEGLGGTICREGWVDLREGEGGGFPEIYIKERSSAVKRS